MAYTKRTWSQKAKSTIVFFISVFITIVVLSAFIYAGLYVKNFAANTTLVVTPIAHIAISVGIITFIVGAYQQSIELLAKKKQALDTLNQYGWLEVEKRSDSGSDSRAIQERFGKIGTIQALGAGILI